MNGGDKITDPLSRETTFDYDNIGRRDKITDDDGNATRGASLGSGLVVGVQPRADGESYRELY